MSPALLSLVGGAPVGDPLLGGKVGWAVLGIVALKVVVTFAVLLVTVLFMVWFERKVISDMQNRIGPDRAGGKFGSLQSLADGLKLFFKEDLLPDRADRRVFRLAPYLALVPAFLSFAIVPVGPVVHVLGHDTRLQLADPPVGILWLLVMSSISVYGLMLAGWSSGSKYPLLGSVRASAQMVSYEAALGLRSRPSCWRRVRWRRARSSPSKRNRSAARCSAGTCRAGCTAGTSSSSPSSRSACSSSPRQQS